MADVNAHMAVCSVCADDYEIRLRISRANGAWTDKTLFRVRSNYESVLSHMKYNHAITVDGIKYLPASITQITKSIEI